MFNKKNSDIKYNIEEAKIEFKENFEDIKSILYKKLNGTIERNINNNLLLLNNELLIRSSKSIYGNHREVFIKIYFGESCDILVPLVFKVFINQREIYIRDFSIYDFKGKEDVSQINTKEFSNNVVNEYYELVLFFLNENKVEGV